MRVSVIGSSGAGKSTFARRLAAALACPHVELDAINWQAGWRGLHEHDPEALVRRAAAALSGEAWVTDGNYTVVRPIILARATDLVWLDYPRPLVMARVIRRSFARAIGGRELWPGTGNREDFRRWLSKEHPIRWAWDTFHRRRRQYDALFADPALAHIARHRLQRPSEAEALINQMSSRFREAKTGTHQHLMDRD